MDEKKAMKVSLGTVICIFMIVVLLVGCGALYYFGFVQNNQKISDLEAQKVALQEKVNSLQETKSKAELQTKKTDDETKELIKNYILTDFGPQNNMKSVIVDSYKEITAEEYFSKTPGGPWTEEEKNEFLKKNSDLMYGYCTFTIELIDANKLTMEGSSATYQEIVGNNFKSEAIFTLNKTTKEINFATSYGFGNNKKLMDEDVIKDLFLAKVKELNNTNSEKLLDYRVDKVEILSNSEKQNWVEMGYNSTDVLATVTYSVKPKDVNKSNWIAGNGEVSGEWIINKTACECLRNGKLVNTTGFATSF